MAVDTADAFQREDAIVIISASSQSNADKAAAPLQAKHPGSIVAGISPDLSNLDSVREAFKSATTQNGCVDFLVNNARSVIISP